MNDAKDTTPTYAGFWIRVAACIIDLVLYTPVYAACYYVFAPNRILSDSVFIVIALVTYAYFFASSCQATPGMRVMKFQVCDVHGNRISFIRSFMWGITGSAGWLIAFTGVLYMMANYDFDAIQLFMQDPDHAPIPKGWEDPEKIQAYFITSIIALALFFVLNLMWSLSIGLSKQKAGFHNLICGTRFVKGKRG